jgi:hypothetical protein
MFTFVCSSSYSNSTSGYSFHSTTISMFVSLYCLCYICYSDIICNIIIFTTNNPSMDVIQLIIIDIFSHENVLSNFSSYPFCKFFHVSIISYFEMKSYCTRIFDINKLNSFSRVVKESTISHRLESTVLGETIDRFERNFSRCLRFLLEFMSNKYFLRKKSRVFVVDNRSSIFSLLHFNRCRQR